MTMHKSYGAPLVGLALLALLCCTATVVVDGHRYSVLLGASQTWSLPADATNVVVSLWGGGGGAASTAQCGASGGSGSAIIARALGDASWDLAASDAVWTVDVGQGGAALGSILDLVAGNGGQTSVVVKAPNGTALFSATAYGGGGGRLLMSGGRRGCQGGAGGGAASSASGVVRGGGTPSGAANDNPLAASAQGAMIGDIKAGGAGAGFSFVNGDVTKPFARGASWTSPGRQWEGGTATYSLPCYTWGGAAGFNGNGGNGYVTSYQVPAANSGSGGGTAYVCPPDRYNIDSPGAAGGVLVDYTHPFSPTVILKSSVSNKYLTAHSYGGVSANAAVAQGWERWVGVRLDDGRYAFRSWQNKYLKVNPTGSVEATAAAASDWEKFTVVYFSPTTWSLKSHHGTYLVAAADGFVNAVANPGHYWTVTEV
ncbi:Fascin-like protein [Pandoravirus quercus]|uniref:Fascin-like protein n=2 Tax=Pandoravirus TaxID=2060084 RepID=A0A2U7UA83_9VIRU|nr:Fascin-like protein [Pandoravirus quercus]AVK75339.1 Fascin-like protein [Pandoravirus quercus]QBZ81516.1 Fascin-like domain containing protein [Pandoravirus celtis]